MHHQPWIPYVQSKTQRAAKQSPRLIAPTQSIFLTAPTTYYVDSIHGSDTSGDGSQGNPWKTIQYATSWVSCFVNPCLNQVVVQALNQVSEFVTLYNVSGGVDGSGEEGGKPLVIRGNVNNPILWKAPAGSVCVRGENCTSGWLVEGFAFSSTVGAMESDKGSVLYFGANQIIDNPLYGLLAITGGTLHITDSYSIINNPNLGGGYSHWTVQYDGFIVCNSGVNATLQGTPNYATALITAVCGSTIQANGVAFNGSRGGRSFYVSQNSTVNGSQNIQRVNGDIIDVASFGYVD